MEGDVLCLIINYYLEGPRNKGDVIVKVKKVNNLNNELIKQLKTCLS